MRSNLVLIALGATLAGCTHSMARGPDNPASGMTPVNVPVVSRAAYTFDAAAPGGVLAAGEAERLDAWFRGLGLRYGDAIYVDGGGSDARNQVADVASVYGMMVLPGAPVTAGALGPDALRVVVSRTEAFVPKCPNWSVPASPNYANAAMSNYGCGVNSNIAAMVANPEDLLRGREATGASDARTATKPVSHYRNAPPTGAQGLLEISTKKDDK